MELTDARPDIADAEPVSASGPPRPVSAVDHFLDSLHAEGVDAVFGVPGGHISALTQALRRQQRVRYFIANHEAGAAFMADGYARAGGKLGVCTVTAGPGATNAITGVASAQLDNVPLLLLSGQTATDRFGQSAIQESTPENGINTVEMLRHCTASSTLVSDVRSFPRLLARAMRTAYSKPAGAVHLCLPANIGNQPIPAGTKIPPVSSTRHAHNACVEETRAVLNMIRRAKRPLLYLGSGAREAMPGLHEALSQFIETHCLPTVTSVRGKGLLDEDHPLSLGVYGIGGSARADRYLEHGVDLLVVIGSRLGEWSSKGFSAALHAIPTLVQVDLKLANIGQTRPAQVPIVAEAGAFLRTLISLARDLRAPAPDARRFEEIAQLQSLPRPQEQSIEDDTLKPQHVMRELNRILRPDTDLYVDMGNCTAWAANYLCVRPPARIFIPCGLSSMGWSCGAVIGGKIARPERRAVSLVGDGAFLMNGSEIGVAAKYGIGTVTIVLQDNYLGTVNHGERASADRAYSIDDPYYSLGTLDLEAFSRALGARSHGVRRPSQLWPCLADAFERAEADKQPQVVVAHIDHRVCPPYGDRFSSVAKAAGGGPPGAA